MLILGRELMDPRRHGFVRAHHAKRFLADRVAVDTVETEHAPGRRRRAFFAVAEVLDAVPLGVLETAV